MFINNYIINNKIDDHKLYYKNNYIMRMIKISIIKFNVIMIS